MNPDRFRHVYGPVPSRRLGRSLGVDLVPFKVCTFDCVYCQLGRTTCKTLERMEYVPTVEVITELKAALESGPEPDYIGLAGSGEPTLNKDIGEVIRAVKALTQIPVAVLTNGSLLWMPEVRKALMKADLVIPSLDAGDVESFQFINRPQESLAFERMVEGIAAFTRDFPGEVWLEVFLLAGVNDSHSRIEKIAALTRRIGPARVQLNTVTRPPAEGFAHAVPPERMQDLLAAFPGVVETICESGRRMPPPESAHRIEDADILSLLGRRPCTPEDIALGLGIHRLEALKHLDGLMATGKVDIVLTGGRGYYTLPNPKAGLVP